MSTEKCIEIRKIPVIKWYETDIYRLAAVSEEALYKFVKESQHGRREPTIVIAEMFPFCDFIFSNKCYLFICIREKKLTHYRWIQLN